MPVSIDHITGNSEISFHINFHGNEVEYDYPVTIARKTKRNFIYFRQQILDNEVPLVFLEAPQIYSHEAISVNNILKRLEASNSYLSTENQILRTDSNVIISDQDNLIFTTEITDSLNGPVPLFYGHRLKPNTDSVTFLPWNKSKDNTVAKLSIDYNFICSNLFNEVDIENGIYRTSFVKSRANNIYYSEIFEAQPIFREATVYDIDPYTYQYDETKPIYLKEILPNGKIQYTFFTNKTIYYKISKEHELNIAIGKNLNSNESWPLILTGKTFSFQNNGLTWDYKFETTRQDYFPYAPYYQVKEEAQIFTDTAILVKNKGIVIDKNKNLHLTFYVYRDNKILFAQSTKDTLINKVLSGNIINNDLVRIESFSGHLDFSNGIVLLSNSLKLKKTDKVIIEYTSEEIDSGVTIHNVNPINQPLLEKHNLLFYASSTNSYNENKKYSKIYWIAYHKVKKLDENNITYKIVTSNDPNITDYMYERNLIDYINDKFLVAGFPENWLYNESRMDTENNFIPLCVVGYNKEFYINQTTLQDARVYAGLKNPNEFLQKNSAYLATLPFQEDIVWKLPDIQSLKISIDPIELDNLSTIDTRTDILNNLPLGFASTIDEPHLINLIFAKAVNWGPFIDNVQITVTIKNLIDNENPRANFFDSIALFLPDATQIDNQIWSVYLDDYDLIENDTAKYTFQLSKETYDSIISTGFVTLKLALHKADDVSVKRMSNFTLPFTCKIYTP